MINSEFEDSTLESSVIKTVRNLKNKKWSPINDVEEVQSRSDSVIQGGKRSPFNNHAILDSELNGYDTLPNSIINTVKLRKSKGSNLSTFGLAEDFGGISLHEGKSDIFKRLAMSKAQAGIAKESKKFHKKENDTNFFDNTYSLPVSELLDLILAKSKIVKGLIESHNLSRGFLAKNIINDSHFNICFKTMLNQLLKDGEITETLKNITKPAFGKLEKFTADKIEAKIKLDNLEISIQDHYKKIDTLNQNRIGELLSNLSS